jgi:mannitol/fructose-specific phosphotransferase system IIA component (Ntr-type)
MQITFKSEHIIAELNSATAFAVIDELIDHVASSGTISPETKEAIALAVKGRERAMSTGIGYGIAIPHATTPLVKQAIIAFGRSVGGVEFDSLDRQPARLVVLLIVPAAQREAHLPTLARVSRWLQRKETRGALQAAADAEAIAAILNENPLVAA